MEKCFDESKYIEAEKQLAELLGWTYVQWMPNAKRLAGWKGDVRKQITRWCRDDAAAFELMCEHVAKVRSGEECIEVSPELNSKQSELIFETIADHLDKRTAVRYAIVQAVTQKLRQKLSGERGDE